ncbi:hypothetical protein Tco_0849501 [Tanacetum coccineum]
MLPDKVVLLSVCHAALVVLHDALRALVGEEFEAFEPSGTMTDSSHSSASSDSTTPLSPDHPLTHVSPTLTPTRALFHHRTARMTGDELGDEDTDKDREMRVWARMVRERAASGPLGLGYEALRHRELAVGEDQVPSTFEVGQSSRSMPERQGAERVSAFRQPTLTTWVDLEDDRVYTDILIYPPIVPVRTSPSLEWSSSSLPIFLSSPVVPSPIASSVATLTATISVDEDQFLEVGAQSGVVRDEIFSQRYMFRSLEREQERVAVTFGALWRPLLVLEAWARQTDA